MPAGNPRGNVVERLNNNSRRIRQLEENLRNIREQLKSLEDDVIEDKKRLNDNKTKFNSETEEIRDKIANIEVDIKNLNRKVRKLVPKREIKEIENYMDLINPVTSSFVTEKEVRKIVKEEIDKSGRNKPREEILG